MGQYKFAFYFQWQIALGFSYSKGYDFILKLPFMDIYFGLTSAAQGIRFFRDTF